MPGKLVLAVPRNRRLQVPGRPTSTPQRRQRVTAACAVALAGVTAKPFGEVLSCTAQQDRRGVAIGDVDAREQAQHVAVEGPARAACCRSARVPRAIGGGSAISAPGSRLLLVAWCSAISSSAEGDHAASRIW